MRFLGKDWHLKRTRDTMYPLVSFGVDLAVCQCANRLGLKVPRVEQLSGDTIGVEIVPGARPVFDIADDELLVPFSDEARLDLAKLIVFDYCVGCVNVYDEGNLLRDVDDYPCYSERHGRNILWDGSSIWYIDYGHVFGRMLMLFSLKLVEKTKLENTIPQHGIQNKSFMTHVHLAIDEAGPEAIKWMKSKANKDDIVFISNIWLTPILAKKMNGIFSERLWIL